MLDGEREEDGQAVISHLLILYSAAHYHVRISVAPVVRYTFHKAVDTLCEEIEPEVAPPLDHLPAFRTPRVCILEQEVGSEAGEYQSAAFNLPRPVTLSLYRKIEVARLSALAAGYLAAVHLILTVDIAVFAPGTNLGATMPRIPVGIYFPMF